MLNKITELSYIQKLILKEYLKNGDTVIDATLGNGYDTKTLLEIVGKTGKVYAYDVQEEAINSSKENLKDFKNYMVEFIQKSHEFMDYKEKNISAIVFNLGYLPNSNHHIKTNSMSTIKALEKGLKFLKINGIISVTAYLGHDDGEEYRALKKFCQNLNSKKYKVIEVNPINQSEISPKLIVIQKLI